jgi:hypothetical protein
VETKVWQDGLKEKFQRSDFYALADAGAYFRKEQHQIRLLVSSRGDRYHSACANAYGAV